MSFFIFIDMKSFIIGVLLFCININAQFTVKAVPPKDFVVNEAILYYLSGSKDMLASVGKQTGNVWTFIVPKDYRGMMKVYFPTYNTSLTFITENKDVEVAFSTVNNKINTVKYNDDYNNLFIEMQDWQKKKEQLLGAFNQIQSYYNKDSEFGNALQKEINYLSSDFTYEIEKNPFLDYYYKNYNKFLLEGTGKTKPTNEEIIQFLYNSGAYLETSSLLRPILILFLGNTTKGTIAEMVDQLLNKVDIETPRGQIILSELIDIFNVYNITDLKEKYLKEAQSLKCTIHERLGTTIKSNNATAIGQKMPNQRFYNPINTKEKSLYEVKAKTKVVIFWSSTCPHCEKEISEMFNKYSLLKTNNVEVIGFSLDTDEKNYLDKAKILPWINDSELKGWYSSYVDKYNVHGTPTFYILNQENIILSSPNNFSGVLDFLRLK